MCAHNNNTKKKKTTHPTLDVALSFSAFLFFFPPVQNQHSLQTTHPPTLGRIFFFFHPFSFVCVCVCLCLCFFFFLLLANACKELYVPHRIITLRCEDHLVGLVIVELRKETKKKITDIIEMPRPDVTDRP